MKSLSRVRLFEIPWTVAYQAPLPWDFPGKSTGVGCHFLLQGIFPTQESNSALPHCGEELYPAIPVMNKMYPQTLLHYIICYMSIGFPGDSVNLVDAYRFANLLYILLYRMHWWNWVYSSLIYLNGLKHMQQTDTNNL